MTKKLPLTVLCSRLAGVAPANSIRPIHEMLDAASASVRDLTPTGGGLGLPTQIGWGVQKKVEGGGVNSPKGM